MCGTQKKVKLEPNLEQNPEQNLELIDGSHLASLGAVIFFAASPASRN